MFRQGVVVGVHPEDHSVDLVMLDDGSRLVGVQVATPNGSTRSGSVDMPSVPDKANKWDITQRTDQDQIALVGYVRSNPVVMGYLYPQVSQMTFKDTKRSIHRHQSDVYWTIDGEGNAELYHPSGAYIRMGATAEHEGLDNTNFDANFSLDRNTGKPLFLRISLAGESVALTMTPDGDLKIKTAKDCVVESEGNVQVTAAGNVLVTATGNAVVKAAAVVVDAPQTTCTGNLTVMGTLTYMGGLAGGAAGSPSNATITGNINVVGDIHATGLVTGDTGLVGPIAGGGDDAGGV